MSTTVYKVTEEDWYGSYEIVERNITVAKLVTVALTQTGPNPKEFKGEFRVCVWGNDDCGMERDFGNDETLALSIFMQVIGLKAVNRKELKALQFVNA
jgi:hypothetical protein